MTSTLLAFAGAAPAWAEDSHPGGLPDTCPEVLNGSPTGDLEKRTDPPDGSEVRSGDEITVTLRWKTESFDGPLLHKVLDCVTVGGEFTPELSGQERDATNDGSFEWRFTVPAGVPAGTRICDRGFAAGPGTGDEFERQKSNDVCFTVTEPAASQDGTTSPSTPPQTDEANRAPAVTPAPSDSAPAPAPAPPSAGSIPDSAPPPAARAPETATAPPAPDAGGVTEVAAPGADRPPAPVTAPASPQKAPATPEVSPDATLARTGSRPGPLVLAGLALLFGGICVMTGAGRRAVAVPAKR